MSPDRVRALKLVMEKSVVVNLFRDRKQKV